MDVIEQGFKNLVGFNPVCLNAGLIKPRRRFTRLQAKKKLREGKLNYLATLTRRQALCKEGDANACAASKGMGGIWSPVSILLWTG